MDKIWFEKMEIYVKIINFLERRLQNKQLQQERFSGLKWNKMGRLSISISLFIKKYHCSLLQCFVFFTILSFIHTTNL